MSYWQKISGGNTHGPPFLEEKRGRRGKEGKGKGEGDWEIVPPSSYKSWGRRCLHEITHETTVTTALIDGKPRVLTFLNLYFKYIFIHMYVCVCVCSNRYIIFLLLGSCHAGGSQHMNSSLCNDVAVDARYTTSGGGQDTIKDYVYHVIWQSYTGIS